MKGTLVEQRVLPPYTDKKPAVTIEFNTTQWSSGVYFVQYESASKMVNKKVVLVR
jgi:hypothetical protein